MGGDQAHRSRRRALLAPARPWSSAASPSDLGRNLLRQSLSRMDRGLRDLEELGRRGYRMGRGGGLDWIGVLRGNWEAKCEENVEN